MTADESAFILFFKGSDSFATVSMVRNMGNLFTSVA